MIDIAAVYQRHEFLDERKDALEHWGDHAIKIVARRGLEHRSMRFAA
jgi:hypothetical protein